MGGGLGMEAAVGGGLGVDVHLPVHTGTPVCVPNIPEQSGSFKQKRRGGFNANANRKANPTPAVGPVAMAAVGRPVQSDWILTVL